MTPAATLTLASAAALLLIRSTAAALYSVGIE